MTAWQCSVCKYIHKEEAPPAKCPVCGVGSEKFVRIELPDPTEKKDAAPDLKDTEKPADARDEARAEAPAAAEPVSEEPEAAATAEAESAKPPQTLYERITDLMIQHHAHPILVHTPQGLVPISAVLFILSWIFDAPVLATVGFVNLIFVILALPPVLYTGILEWEKKYMRADTLIFKLKILFAALTTASCVISVVWYFLAPDVLASGHAWVFILLNLVMLASAVAAGHIGGKFVFKD